MTEKGKNRERNGSALLMTVVAAGILSVLSLAMVTSALLQAKIQRRILMQENNFCYLEQKMEELLPELETLTEETAKECRKKAIREAKKAAADTENAGQDSEAAAQESTVQMLYEEQCIRKLKRCLRPQVLEKLLGNEENLSITIESVRQKGDSLLVKGLRFSGSAPGSQIRSTVSSNLRILVPELVWEAASDSNADPATDPAAGNVRLEQSRREKRNYRK